MYVCTHTHACARTHSCTHATHVLLILFLWRISPQAEPTDFDWPCYHTTKVLREKEGVGCKWWTAAQWTAPFKERVEGNHPMTSTYMISPCCRSGNISLDHLPMWENQGLADTDLWEAETWFATAAWRVSGLADKTPSCPLFLPQSFTFPQPVDSSLS